VVTQAQELDDPRIVGIIDREPGHDRRVWQP
jgi:hypothetical protein